MVQCSCLNVETEAWVGCEPVSTSLVSGSVCVQVNGVCAGTGGQVQQVWQEVPQI